MKRPLKVAIDARILPGVSGGVAVAVKSLLQGLGRLPDGDEEYVIITHSDEQYAWVSSFLGPNQRIVRFSRPAHPGVRGVLLSMMRPVAKRVRQEFDRRVWPEVPISDGFHEGLGCDVLHLPTQNFLLCALPTVYNPHDLQHLRYPQFFTPDILAWRETTYPAGCHFARTVVVGSEFIKDDVVRRYGVDSARVQIIPEAAPSEVGAEPSPEDLVRVRTKYRLQEPFSLFPSVTWPHKNHLQLFRALAVLRDSRGVTVPLVCTGSPFPAFWPRIEAGLREFRLSDQVTFTGHVSENDLRALYRLAACLVFPSLYEASSLPIFEAWLDGIPVACSNAAALPQQVRDAALLFDPNDPEDMATAIAAVLTNQDLRAALRARGTARLKDFDFQRTAKAYRAVYRRAGERPPTDEDRELLRWDWMRGVPQ